MASRQRSTTSPRLVALRLLIVDLSISRTCGPKHDRSSKFDECQIKSGFGEWHGLLLFCPLGRRHVDGKRNDALLRGLSYQPLPVEWVLHIRGTTWTQSRA